MLRKAHFDVLKVCKNLTLKSLGFFSFTKENFEIGVNKITSRMHQINSSNLQD